MFLVHPSIFLWDFLIVFVLCFCAAVAVGSTVLLRRNARPLLHTIGIELCGAVCVVCFCILVYSAFIEPKTLVVTEHTAQVDITEPLKIVVISDMQVGPYKGSVFLEHVVTEVNRLLPDMVFMPGDFIFDSTSDITTLAPLRNIRASAGVYAVLGNHDQGRNRTIFGAEKTDQDKGEAVADYLTTLGIRVLRNEHEVVSLGTENIVVAGIDDMWTGHGDIGTALADAPTELYTFLLSHNPSIIEDEAAKNVDFVVSGHTHGGQVRLPFIGPIRSIPISIDQSYDQGLFNLGNQRYLAITRGIGETWARVRLLAWPEILLLHIQ